METLELKAWKRDHSAHRKPCASVHVFPSPCGGRKSRTVRTVLQSWPLEVSDKDKREIRKMLNGLAPQSHSQQQPRVDGGRQGGGKVRDGCD